MYIFFNYDTSAFIQEIKAEKKYIYEPYFTTNNHLIILNMLEFFTGTIQSYSTIVSFLIIFLRDV